MSRRETAVARRHAASPPGWSLDRIVDRVGELGPLVAGYALPFLLVFYLGLEGGGYDAVVRSEVGIAVWWIVLLGVLVGLLPTTRVPRLAWIGVVLLLAFGAWTTLAISWSESSERSVAEVARVATLLGIFLLCALTQGRESLRRAVCAVAAAIGLLGGLALLSRLQPGWITPEDAAGTTAVARTRLNYPLDYWNGLAALIAVGIPLLLGAATQARRTLSSALSAAAIPALALAAFYTLSRGGAGEIAIVLIGFIALYPRRLAALPTIGVTVGGAALLIVAATQRDALENSPFDPQAASQGDEMLAMTLVVCAGVGLIQAALALARTHGLGPRVEISRRTSLAALGTAAVAAIAIALAVGLPGEISDRWNEFKQPGGPSETSASRFESASGSNRYQLWGAAIDANATAPLTGIGAGTYEFWEARSGTIASFVRDAHSLYLESLAELGIVGLALIIGLVGLVLVVGASRAWRAGSSETRGWLAAATAACLAFAVAAGVDWAWEVAVLPVAFLVLAAAILGQHAETPTGDRSRFAAKFPRFGRPLIAALALLSMVLIAIPMAGTEALRSSQDHVNDNRLDLALDQARSASNVQPYAASPALQEALVQELNGDLDSASEAARKATQDESTNWRTWLTLSRIEAERGRAEESLAAYREARVLNPRSVLFE